MTNKSASKSNNSAKSLAALGTLAALGNTPIDATLIADGGQIVEMDENELLGGLLDGVEGMETLEAAGDEIIESAHAESAIPEDLLDDVIAHVDSKDANAALYAAQDGPIDDGSAPTTVVATPVDKAAAKLAKKEAADAARAQKAADKAAAKAALPPAAPKVPRATSITHKPGALLAVKLGAGFRDYVTFDVKDATLNAGDLIAKQDAFIDRMNDRDAIADKVKEKIQMFLTWIQKGGELNEVMKRAITVLHDKGELTSGDKGNLQINLLSKPYSMGTARSQANQMFMAFPELGLVIKEKGRMVANPDSTLLPMAVAALKLA